MRTAVVYYSMSGNTEYVAKAIAEELPADLVCIAPQKAYPSSGFRKFLWGGKAVFMHDSPKLLPYEFDATAYERVIFGTPVWAGSFAPPLRTFIDENKDAFAQKRIAAFACSASGDGEKCFAKLVELLGKDGLEAELLLVDPKDKRKREDETAIRDFCSRLG